MNEEEEDVSDPGCWESSPERRIGFISQLSERETEIIDLIRRSIPERSADRFVDWLERLTYPQALALSARMEPEFWMAIANRFPDQSRPKVLECIARNRNTLLLLRELLSLRAEGVKKEMVEVLEEEILAEERRHRPPGPDHL